MNNKKYIIMFLLILLILTLFSSFTFAVGTCEMDKYDYNPDETALFDCRCDTPQEQNRAGFIVFFRDDGTILKSTAINSGNCQTSFFGDSYTFLIGANFTGNATFSLNADGTGKPAQWDGVTDINFDTYNVSGASANSCIIKWEGDTNPIYTLGRFASISIEVEDGITLSPLVEATCTFHLEDVNNVHILSEPYGIDGFGIKSIAGGEATFQQQFNVDTAKPSTTYLGKAYCHCTPNGTDNQCYFDDTGEVAGYKTCKSTILLTTSSEDYRNKNDGIKFIGIILIFVIMIAAYVFLGRLNQKSIELDPTKVTTWLTVVSYSMVIVKIITLSYFTYGYYIEENLTALLLALFTLDLILIGIIITLSLFFGVLSISKFNGKNDKWTNGKW